MGLLDLRAKKSLGTVNTGPRDRAFVGYITILTSRLLALVTERLRS